MPLYDFECKNCGYGGEILIKLDEEDPNCSKCGEKMDKVMSSVPFILKGRGWASDSYGLKDGGKKNGNENKRSS